jgi:hypothetical protein
MPMQMLSDDDLNLRDLSAEDLARAWDLWFDLAQATNDDDPLYTHGVFQNAPQTENGRTLGPPRGGSRGEL